MRRLALLGALSIMVLAGCGETAPVETEAAPTTPTTPTSIATQPQYPAHHSSSAGGFKPCGRGITVNRHASCPFADNVLRAYPDTSSSAQREIAASSPVTGQTYVLHCRTSAGAVTCEGGTDAVVRFPTPEEPSTEASSESDQVGSRSHAKDAQFCQEHECIGSFETEPGRIVECSDGSFSHAGGISGACSFHGGEGHQAHKLSQRLP
jgi:hypothetical protein